MKRGVIQCDSYSIDQLTTIWKNNKKMRPSMRSLMSRCFDCLRDKATIESDTTAISQLIHYYTEGIGTQANEERARSWSNRLEELRRPMELISYIPQKKKAKRTHGKFFCRGYAFSIEAPYGLTGWRCRERGVRLVCLVLKPICHLITTPYECRGTDEFVSYPDNTSLRFTNERK